MTSINFRENKNMYRKGITITNLPVILFTLEIIVKFKYCSI